MRSRAHAASRSRLHLERPRGNGRTAPHILLAQGHKISLEIREVIGPLGEFATATETAIREAMRDLFMLDHDISRHPFTVFRLGALKGRVLRVI